MSLKREVVLQKSAQNDAFQRLRISDPFGLFDSHSRYDRRLLQYYEKTTISGSLTHNPNESTVDLAVTATNGSHAIRQSKRYMHYQPGKSQQILITSVFDSTQSNTIKRAGYYDDENGIFLERSGDTVSFVLRSNVTGSVVDNTIPSTAWNVDRFTGEGGGLNPSGISLDFNKGQITTFDIEWLGLGSIRCGFIVNGQTHYAHEYHHANSVTTTYMTSADLPIRWEIENGSSNTAGNTDSMKSVCGAVHSEGGAEIDRGFPFSAINDAGKAVTTTGWLPVLSMRLQQTFQSITSRVDILLPQFNFLANGDDIFFKVTYDGTVAGGTYTSVNTTFSSVEVNTTAESVTGGIDVLHQLVPSGQGNSSFGDGADLLARLPLSLDIDGANPISLTIQAKARSGNGTAYASVDWQEII